MQPAGEEFKNIDLTRICPNPWNPRKRFSGEKFDDLVDSIKQKGVLEPILVRPLPDGGKLIDETSWPNHGRMVDYEIVAGERRFRACFQIARDNGGPAGKTIPALIKPLNDDEAFDVMTIENIQREDLTELEEASNFKMYLDRKGKDAVEELSSRTGIHPAYIRRRVRVLSLPRKVLNQWDRGKLKYGHLEQLCRLKGAQEVNRWTKTITQERWGDGTMSVSELKRRIDNQSPPLSAAFFDTQKAGCLACAHNSDVQKKLFAVDQSDKTICTSPACFKQKQNNYLSAHWAQTPLRKKYRTNGFCFEETFDWSRHALFYKTKEVFAECKPCDRFVTVLHTDGTIYHERACLDKACREKLEKARSRKKRQSGDDAAATGDGDACDAPRVAWHGEHFREIFYQQTIRERTEHLPWNDDRMMRMLLFALLTHCGDTLGAWFAQRHDLIDPDSDEAGWFFLDRTAALAKICAMDINDVMEDLGDATVALVLDKTVTTSQRSAIGDLLGIDLAAEWCIDAEYLAKKTTGEMLAFGEKLGIFADPSAEAFLKETLGRRSFKACKKSELLRVFLESGADLAGKVPDEILGINREAA